MAKRAETAVALRVPLTADPVDSPEVLWGHMRAVVFTVRESESPGRITFEGLDAIRVSRGEYPPYEEQEDNHEGWEWVYVVENSRWLDERHHYENDLYDTPLLESHLHFVFRFDDEFVEAIARGIWFDEPEANDPFGSPATHPLRGLPEDAVTVRSELFGLDCELRTNPTPVDQLIEASALCSQPLFQYNVVLNGRSRELATVWLRTRRGETFSSFVKLLSSDHLEQPGVATALTFHNEWRQLAEGLASRRQGMDQEGA